jgi:hypothetical protein
MPGPNQNKPNQSLLNIYGTLFQHQNKNFVQRILNPQDYPKLYDNSNGPLNSPSTHSMTWGTDEQGNAYVYPTVVMHGNKLRRLNDKQAWQYAKATGEYIPFGKRNIDADWFSKNYKRIWKDK